jgi:AcrR family transcriptional regulator
MNIQGFGDRRRWNKKAAPDRVEVMRERVLAVARGIVAQGDLSALTCESLVRSLRMRPTSLFKLFGGLDQVRDALTVRALEELTELVRSAIGGCAGREALQAYLEVQRLYAQAHPGMYEAAMRRLTELSPAAEQALEAYADVELAALRAYGLAIGDVAALSWCLRACVRGAIGLEASDRLTKPHDIDQNLDRLISLVDASARLAAPAVEHRPPSNVRMARQLGRV